MDTTAWEHQHTRMYGCGPWERAVRQASVLYDWHLARRGLGAQARMVHVAQPSPAHEQEWAADRAVLALILWRTARDDAILVDQLSASDALPYCTSSGSARLFGGPLPAAGAPQSAADGWNSRLEAVLRQHAAAEPAVPYSVGPSWCLGYRVRGLRANPGWLPGDWITPTRRARHAIEHAVQNRHESREAEQAAAARLGLGAPPVYDYPSTTATLDHPMWLQRAHRLTSLAATLRTVCDTLPHDDHPHPGTLGAALTACAAVFDAVRESAEEVERLWAAEPQEPADLDLWDVTHVPGQLDRQTTEAEQLAQALSTYLSMP